MDHRDMTALKERGTTTPGTATATPVYTLDIESFDVPARLVNNQRCGNGRDDAFEASVSLSVGRLDGNGFVIEVHDFIETVRRHFASGMFKASCEELTGAIVNVAFHRLGQKLEAARVTVFNQTGSVSLDWKRGQKVPDFPRPGTTEEIRQTERARRRGQDAPAC